MKQVVVTGVGINTEFISNQSLFSQLSIDSLQEKKNTENDEDLFSKSCKFNSSPLIKREDRAFLNNCAKLTIDAVVDAFNMAESCMPFTKEDKKNFCIYIANEAIENSFNAVEKFSSTYRDNNNELDWTKLGSIKEFLNPLDMLRLLSTNPLYHVSKILELNGGGYPLRRMSLSGLIALEDAYYSIPERSDHALVVGTGDLKILENLCVFKKMSLLRTHGNENGIVPSFGSAAVILELNDESINRKAFAEIISIRSLYFPDNHLTEMHWKKLYSTFPKLEHKNLSIIFYDNGVSDLAIQEIQAMRNLFPQAQYYAYKKYYGYTGKANTLVDLITALADNRIPVDSYVVINGVGMSVGIGYILIRKLANFENLE